MGKSFNLGNDISTQPVCSWFVAKHPWSKNAEHAVRKTLLSVWQKRRRFPRTAGLPAVFRSACLRVSEAGPAPRVDISASVSVFRGFGAGSAVGRLAAGVFFGEAPLRRRGVVGTVAAVRGSAAFSCAPTASARARRPTACPSSAGRSNQGSRPALRGSTGCGSPGRNCTPASRGTPSGSA